MSKKISAFTELAALPADNDLFLLELSSTGAYRKLKFSNLLKIGAVTPEKMVSGTGTTWNWASWTPTWANFTLGNGTVTAMFKQHGKTVIGEISLVLGSTSVMGTAPTFSLPVAAAARYATTNHHIGGIYIEDSGVAGYGGHILISASTTVGLAQALNAAGTYVVPAGFAVSTPFTWGAGDYFRGHFIYEAA